MTNQNPAGRVVLRSLWRRDLGNEDCSSFLVRTGFLWKECYWSPVDRTNPPLVLGDQANFVSLSKWQSEMRVTVSFTFCRLLKGDHGMSPAGGSHRLRSLWSHRGAQSCLSSHSTEGQTHCTCPINTEMPTFMVMVAHVHLWKGRDLLSGLLYCVWGHLWLQYLAPGLKSRRPLRWQSATLFSPSSGISLQPHTGMGLLRNSAAELYSFIPETSSLWFLFFLPFLPQEKYS